MNCRKYRGMVSRELDGALDGIGREDLERHLASCAGCRRFRDLSLASLSMHRSVRESDPPPTLLSSILAAVEVGPRSGWMRGWLRFAVPAAAAAVAVIGLWIGGLMHANYVPASAGNQTDVLELAYLDEYPPGSLGEILMTSSGGGGDEQR